MVAKRAFAPGSKLDVEEWIKIDVFLDTDQSIQVQHLYRVMDFGLEHEEWIQREGFWSVANPLSLEVEVVFFDTTRTYFETKDEEGLKRYGHSRDKRNDLPQAAIGLVVAKDGIFHSKLGLRWQHGRRQKGGANR